MGHEFSKLTDEALVLLVKADAHDAFAEIYHRYKGLLVLHANKKLVGDLEESKEIIQEVFSNFWYNRQKMPVINNLQAYLYTLVRNKILNHIEHQQVVSRYEASFTEFSETYQYRADTQIREKQMKAIIDQEIAALPPKMREVFMLSRHEHLTHKDIAEKLEISEFTVKNHIKAALKILRSRLDVGLILMLLKHYQN